MHRYEGDPYEPLEPVPTGPDDRLADAVDVMLARLEALAALRARGVLTAAEFEAQKRRIVRS